MAALYEIEKVQDTTYLDDGGRPIRGFGVRFKVPAHNEVHELNVPTADPKTVDKAIKDFIVKRDALSKLGQS